MDRTVFERARKVIVDQLDVREDDVTPDASFVEDLGADSLDLVEMVMAFEQEFEINITDDESEKIRTVADAVQFLSSKVAAEVG
ncbi:MAG: acyl carrier protein [Fimbriimonadia bacterium]|nr:acyl carrier protein [Fimbriimonadia bacterium]